MYSVTKKSRDIAEPASAAVGGRKWKWFSAELCSPYRPQPNLCTNQPMALEQQLGIFAA